MPALIKWTTETYNWVSGVYQRVFDALFPLSIEGRKRVVRDLPEGTLLDVACGTGILLDRAHKKGYTCAGIDLSDGMLRQAQKLNGEFNLVRGSFYDLPFREKAFTTVSSTNAISGEGIDAVRVLGEMLRVARGQLRVVDYVKPDEETLWNRFLMWLGRLIGDQPNDYHALFKELGYQAHTEQIGHPMYKYIQVNNKIQAIHGRGDEYPF